MDHPLAAPPSLTPDEARAWWYGLINFEQRTPAAADLKLDHMRTLLARLGDPHRRLRIVHVAGSKGKGSTSAMLASILRQAGYRTGLFTSPHLCRVEERLPGGRPSHQHRRADHLAERGPLMSRAAASPQRPECPTPFSRWPRPSASCTSLRRRVEAAVLEVGLGGRLDSTNVCTPVVSRHHQHQLRSHGDAGRSLGQHRGGEGGHHQAETPRCQRRDGSRSAERSSSASAASAAPRCVSWAWISITPAFRAA